MRDNSLAENRLHVSEAIETNDTPLVLEPLGDGTGLDPMEITAAAFPIGKHELLQHIDAETHGGELATISRRHAEIRFEEGAYTLCDLASTNGTVLNGRRLAADESVMLADGDRITLGHALFSYRVAIGASPAPAEENASAAPVTGTAPEPLPPAQPVADVSPERPPPPERALSIVSEPTSRSEPAADISPERPPPPERAPGVEFEPALQPEPSEPSEPSGPSGPVDHGDTRLFSTSIDALAQVLEGERAPLPSFGDALVDAAAMVGAAGGLSISPPGESDRRLDFKDPFEAVARASHIRFRHVLLEGDWWRHDCGPMLGYLERNHRPVALLMDGASGYLIVDPESGERTAVDRASAATLELKAVTLYRKLPEKIESVWRIPRWAMRGRASDLVFVALLSLAVTLIGMLVPQATAIIIDNAVPDANRRLIGEIGAGLVLAAFGVAALGLAQGILSIRLGTHSDATSQSAVWDRLLGVKLGIFKRFGSGDLLDRAMGVSAVNRELNGQTMRSLLTSVTALLNLGLLYWYSSKLAMMVLGIGLVVVLFTVLAGLLVRGHYRTLMDMQGKFYGFVIELVGATGKIRVAGAQRRAFAQWSSRYTAQLGLMLKAQAIEDYIVVFNDAVPLISTIFLYWLAADMLFDPNSGEALSVGIFLAFNTAMGTFLGGLTFLSTTALEFMDTLAKAKRTKPILQAPLESGEDKADPGILRGKVSLADVHFRYEPDAPMVLRGVDLVVEPGQFAAFVGTSGSGKSTIFRLLLGFEEAASGRVLYDDQDLAGLDLTAVRRQLGVVLQAAHIGAGPLLESIGAGAPVTLEQAWEAAEDAGFADDIHQMPMGMHTVISEGGGNLSGGQRQRLIIARALARRPKILLFDEATSALDNRTQAIVSRSLERRAVTRLVVAHRLSTIREADRIFVLDKGRVAESGTYDTLGSGEGLFARMMRRQSAPTS